jgi:C4-type Zn-finger protein
VARSKVPLTEPTEEEVLRAWSVVATFLEEGTEKKESTVSYKDVCAAQKIINADIRARERENKETVRKLREYARRRGVQLPTLETMANE